VVKGPAADATDAPQPSGLLCNPLMTTISVSFGFPSNEAPVEWNWQGKTEALGDKPAPVPLCPPQITHVLTRDRTRASAVRGRRLTAWVMARPKDTLSLHYVNSSFIGLRQSLPVSTFDTRTFPTSVLQYPMPSAPLNPTDNSSRASSVMATDGQYVFKTSAHMYQLLDFVT
jgi:hypothetical protein